MNEPLLAVGAQARAIHRTLAAARLGVLALASTAALAATAGAQSPAYYFSTHTATGEQRYWPASIAYSARPRGGLSVDAGRPVGMTLGRRTENARFEFEYQRGRFQLRGTDLGAVSESVGGGGSYETLLFNADRVLPVNGALSAYVGGGLGWGSFHTPRVGVGSTGLAYQARVGLEYSLGSGPQLYLQAGWISLPGAASTDMPGVDSSRRGSATLDAGLRFRF